MAGMLPGVESARRRRFHHGRSSDQPSGSRRSSFCMYTTSQETNLSSTSMRSGLNKGSHGGALGNIAREAKERLDERLRTQRALEIMRHNSMRSAESGGGDELDPLSFGNVQREVFCSKRSFSWSKMGWKASEQAECAVCLDEFKRGDILVHLPCAHRFHLDCVAPWLESSSHCPCCRTTVFS